MKKPQRLLLNVWLAGLLLPWAPVWAQAGGSSVVNSKHNLSATGPGAVKVAGAADVCKFCHTPHAANPIAPLWNRDDPGTYYQTYESSTLKATVGQPTGSSRLCLSCHDGTIALTQTYNGRNLPGGTVFISAHDRGYLGTDLSDDHPISFVYDTGLTSKNTQLRSPASLPRQLPLDREGQLQCTTCHDPHDDSLGQFLRMDNTESRMCVACHQMTGWASSPHAVSTRALSTARRETWDNLKLSATVRQAGCESCHRPHSASGRQRLLRHEAEEDNCLGCHDGSVAQTNIEGTLNRLSIHPVRETTGVHDPAETPGSMSMHVECADCHNPHQMASGSSGGTRAPQIKPVMQGASGASASGQRVDVARFEYEVCFKCHAGTNPAGVPQVHRQDPNTDMSSDFSPASLSYHPVMVPGKNRDVPSLERPLNATSMIYCTDCHGSDDAAARGPHGSNHRPLLVRNYSMQDGAGESPMAYDLCYQCHNRASILADQSFKYHKKHIVDEQTACAVCHDPHGTRVGTHLINFDRDVVGPSTSANTGPTFTDLGRLRGSCTLSCHGKDHVNEQYPDD
ncbi:MAG: hypothetical protein IT443_11520 [Phycisphaeraceae bacterium]|nr:hypothetical protein [Phycisphaeraceae bacterium]